MKPTKNLSHGSATVTRTTAYLAIDENSGYYVYDAALIVQLDISEAIAAWKVESGTGLSRRARLASNPLRAAAIEHARRKIGLALDDDSSRHGLARLRLSAGLSQAQVAQILGTQQPAIARLEKGEQDPSLSTMRKLAQAFGVGIEQILQAFDGSKVTAE